MLFNRLRRVMMLAVGALLAGCATMQPSDFAQSPQTLLIEDYFNGHTTAHGLFEDRFGTVRRQFVVEIDGTRVGDTLTLDEHFLYNDGETERRVWTIKKLSPGHYEGTAGDVVGVAEGQAMGNALRWAYHLNLKTGSSTTEVAFDDWMFLEPGNVLLNHAHVRKWGVEIGDVFLSFSKRP